MSANSRFLNLDTDGTLSANSDEIVPSQKAIKTYVDNHSGGGGGSTAVDNLSITKNTSNEIQTIGVIDQNAPATAIKKWTGTKAQYDAIATKDLNTDYEITDDVDPQAQLDINQIVSDLNLKAGIDLANLSNAGEAKFNSKAETDLSNITTSAGANLNAAGVRTVVQTYVNGSSWYRVWSDGWIEQGGSTLINGGGAYSQNTTVNLLKSFANTDYSLVACMSGPEGSYWAQGSWYAMQSSASAFTITRYNWQGTSAACNFNWYTAGYQGATK